MPKIISDYEREQTQIAIIKHTKQIILLKRGVRDITVDDIVRSVGFGKGSFYSYFKSKEECLYRVLETAVADVYEQIKIIKQHKMSTREKAVRFLREVYLADDRVNYYFSTTDIQAMFRKLPPEYAEMEQNFIGDGLINDIMEFMNIDKVQAEAFNMLLKCMEFAYFSDSSKEVKDEVIDALVQTIADYVERHSTI